MKRCLIQRKNKEKTESNHFLLTKMVINLEITVTHIGEALER